MFCLTFRGSKICEENMKYWITIQGSPKFMQHKLFIFAATVSFQFSAHEKQLQQVSLL